MGWLKDVVEKIHDIGQKIDPIGTKIKSQTAKIPGSHAALEEGLYRGAIGEASWNPYDANGVAVGDIWGGGTMESRDPDNRALGRQIGTAIGSYFGGQALGGLFSGGSTAASGTGAGYTGTASELAADGLGGEAAGAVGAGEVGAATSTGVEGMGGGSGITGGGGVGFNSTGGGVGFQAPAGTTVETFLGSPETYSSGLGTAGGTAVPTNSYTSTTPTSTSSGLEPTTSEQYIDSGGMGQGKPAAGWTAKDYLKGAMKINEGMSAYDSYRNNKQQREALSPYVDQNRLYAQQLAELYNNPEKSYADFMAGGGRQFMTDARAKAASTGRIGSYVNSGKMNTDLYSQYLMNMNNRAQSLQRSMDSTAPYVNQYNAAQKNKNAPLYSGLASIGSSFL